MAIPQGLLADPAELAEVLGVASDDVRLVAEVRSASRRFRGAVTATFEPVDAAELRCNGDGSVTLLLQVWPLRGVTTVEVGGQAVTDYEWSAEGILRRSAGWPDGLRSVRVVCDYGYETVPEDVQEVVLDQAEAHWNTKRGLQSLSVDGQAVTFGAAATVGVTQAWADAVARYSHRGDRA